VHGVWSEAGERNFDKLQNGRKRKEAIEAFDNTVRLNSLQLREITTPFPVQYLLISLTLIIAIGWRDFVFTADKATNLFLTEHPNQLT
jgi:hypothetical protein